MKIKDVLLRCETNTQEIKEEIVSAADFRVEFSDGCWFVRVCDSIFAVCDTNYGFEFELL